MTTSLPDDPVAVAAREMLRDLANDKGSADRERVISILTDALCDSGIPREIAETIAEESLGKFGTPGKNNHG